MKKFEKWNKANLIKHFCDSGQMIKYVEEERENAWKDALEWTLTNSVIISPVNSPELQYAVVPVDIIEKELQE